MPMDFGSMETTSSTVNRGNVGIDPHGGGSNVHPNFSYQCKNRRIFSALTRVVWELNEVEAGNGGTLLMSGTHKANFAVPECHRVKESGLFETYSCAPGSVLFFTENLCHSGADWQMPHPRIAIFNCYTHSQAQYHKMNWNTATVAEWPRKRPIPRARCVGQRLLNQAGDGE